MSKLKISDYDATANNNTDVAGVNIDEGCAPSGINNAIRAVMSHLKDFQQGTNGDPFNGPVNGTIGTTTPAAGAFTTLSTTGNTTLGDDAGDVITINGTTTFNEDVTITSGSFNGAVGATTPSTGAFTTLSASGAVTLSGGTANGVAYLNGSKVLTTGSALTFDGTNLGIGTSSPGEKLRVTSTGTNEIRTHSSSSGDARVGFWAEGAAYNYIQTTRSNGSLGYFADTHLFNSGSGAERMRINSSGNLLVGGTTQRDSAKITNEFNGGNGLSLYCVQNTNAVDFAVFRANAGSLCGNISRVGTTNAVVYASASDYRLKENITPMTGALAKVAQLRPVTYNWKDGGAAADGFIAHELAEVCPSAVVGDKDAVDSDGNPKYQSVDTSFLVATLTAAIQEQQAIIEQLKADVAALKGAA